MLSPIRAEPEEIADGSYCVEEDPRFIFEYINEIRALDTDGDIWQLLVLWEDSNSYLFEDETEILCYADD